MSSLWSYSPLIAALAALIIYAIFGLIKYLKYKHIIHSWKYPNYYRRFKKIRTCKMCGQHQIYIEGYSNNCWIGITCQRYAHYLKYYGNLSKKHSDRQNEIELEAIRQKLKKEEIKTERRKAFFKKLKPRGYDGRDNIYHSNVCAFVKGKKNRKG